MVPSNDSDMLYQPVTYTFEEETITWSREDGSEGRHRWDSINKVDRESDYFLLHLSTSGSLYIPRAAMPDPQVFSALENVLIRVGLLEKQ